LEKIQEKQEFTAKDVLGVFTSLVVLLAVGLVMARHASDDYKVLGAERAMVKLSRQLISHGKSIDRVKDTELASASRGLASVDPGPGKSPLESLGFEGKISQDPWGQPYHYKVFQKGSELYGVAIWSNGPNTILEVSESDILQAESGRVVRILKSGDDLSHFETLN